jgi:hypothetical protein
MSRAGGVLLALSFGFASSAVAQTPPDQATADVLRYAEPSAAHVGCKSEADDSVVVCGRRSERYRIDRSVYEASRAASANAPKPSLSAQAITEMRYGQPLDRGRVMPTDLTKMPAEKALMMAIKGEDWRAPLLQEPDQYATFEKAKNGASRK